MDCPNDNIVPENLDFCASAEVTPGVSEVNVLWAKYTDFEAVQSLVDLSESTTNEEAGKILESHTFKTGKGFAKIQLVTETGGVDTESLGPLGSKSFKNMLSGSLNSMSARNIGFFRANINQPGIALVKESTGLWKQIGDAKKPAYMNENKGTTGKTKEDTNKFDVVFETVSSSPAPVYEGTITYLPEPVV